MADTQRLLSGWPMQDPVAMEPRPPSQPRHSTPPRISTPSPAPQPQPAAVASGAGDEPTRPATSPAATGRLPTHLPDRVTDLELTKQLMKSAAHQNVSGHRLHRTYLIGARHDRRLAIPADRAGQVIGAISADWLGMSDAERSLRRDFYLVHNRAQPLYPNFIPHPSVCARVSQGAGCLHTCAVRSATRT
jgi:hypothetical protein